MRQFFYFYIKEKALNKHGITFVVENVNSENPVLTWVMDQRKHVFPIGFLRFGWDCKESQDLCDEFPELSNVDKLALILWAWQQIHPEGISIY